MCWNSCTVFLTKLGLLSWSILWRNHCLFLFSFNSMFSKTIHLKQDSHKNKIRQMLSVNVIIYCSKLRNTETYKTLVKDALYCNNFIINWKDYLCQKLSVPPVAGKMMEGFESLIFIGRHRFNYSRWPQNYFLLHNSQKGRGR